MARTATKSPTPTQRSKRASKHVEEEEVAEMEIEETPKATAPTKKATKTRVEQVGSVDRVQAKKEKYKEFINNLSKEVLPADQLKRYAAIDEKNFLKAGEIRSKKLKAAEKQTELQNASPIDRADHYLTQVSCWVSNWSKDDEAPQVDESTLSEEDQKKRIKRARMVAGLKKKAVEVFDLALQEFDAMSEADRTKFLSDDVQGRNAQAIEGRDLNLLVCKNAVTVA